MSAPRDLRVEHLGYGVLGLGEPRPRLSWKLPDGARHQRAFELELDGRAHGRVDGADHVLVPWRGSPLVSRRLPKPVMQSFA